MNGNKVIKAEQPQVAGSSPQPSIDTRIKVEGVSKKFCRSLKKSLWYGMQDIGREITGRRHGGDGQLRQDEFWAVKDVSFELNRGECLGLIGRNGAGKTTLLRMLNGLIKPDQGRIEMRGRVGALIALGAGFNPILTGRENISVNASLLGLSNHEIDEKIEEIIDFAEIGDFIDSPVQTYSSGMQVRLGFAVATALLPEVLLIDEVLAVGDTAFKVRCYNRIRDILPRTAVIFVSHSMQEIARISSRVLVLKSGRTYFSGSKEDGIYAYESLNYESTGSQSSNLIVHRGPFVSDVQMVSYETGTSGIESYIEACLYIRCEIDLGRVRIRLVIHDDSTSASAVAEWDSNVAGEVYELKAGDNHLSLKASRIRLRTGHYRVILVVTDPGGHGFHVTIEYGLNLEVRNSVLSGAHYRI
jgi:homopolymeric O-antigen transport system ATP-binding protein